MVYYLLKWRIKALDWIALIFWQISELSKFATNLVLVTPSLSQKHFKRTRKPNHFQHISFVHISTFWKYTILILFGEGGADKS